MAKQNLSVNQILVPEDEQPYNIPENWTWVRLGNFVEILSGFPFESDSFSPDPRMGIPLIRIRDVVRGFTETYTSQKCDDVYIINFGDILIGMDGDFNVATWKSEKAYLNQRVCKIKSANSALIDSYFLYYLPMPLLKIHSSTPSVTVKHLSTKTINSIPFPLPPLAEQQRIVERIETLFEKLDQAKELVQHALDSFEKRKAAILHKAFKGELTAKWREENDISIDNWSVHTLGEVCTINPPKSDVSKCVDDLDVSFIPMPAVSEISGKIETPQIKHLGDVKKGYTNFCEGDVIFAKITPCMENGKSAIVGPLVNNIGFGSTEFYVLRCSPKLNSRYLHYMVRNQKFRDEAQADMTGAVGQQRVPRSFLENYSLSLPDIFEQQEIVHILDGIFEKENHAFELYDIIEKIDLIKKSILAKAFRGKLGTNNPNDDRINY
ncbi:Type-1 restriction enzyme EcoKI specificity protein [Methanosarcinaceae archaeon Ag5]|uniref:Type-1 restriction enzyme EcoKI specificity protein n=1 Tax=Methanolapillus africanus TaxID=3028297 RepID=A0AAE4MJ44_9EURY|nr:Type-1 restriction enzyme EcoKI specificity protein [Methanosarcinaceae archaeon Ag5]